MSKIAERQQGIDHEKVAQERHANISLAKRLELVLPEIPYGGTIASLGSNGEGSDIAEKKHGDIITEKNIILVAAEDIESLEDRSADVVIGNILSGETLPYTLSGIARITKPEGYVRLNLHRGPNQNGNFADEELLETQLYATGMHISRTEMNERGGWWEVDATTMPDTVPVLPSELREQPIPFEIGGDVYDWKGGDNNYA